MCPEIFWWPTVIWRAVSYDKSLDPTTNTTDAEQQHNFCYCYLKETSSISPTNISWITWRENKCWTSIRKAKLQEPMEQSIWKSNIVFCSFWNSVSNPHHRLESPNVHVATSGNEEIPFIFYLDVQQSMTLISRVPTSFFCDVRWQQLLSHSWHWKRENVSPSEFNSPGMHSLRRTQWSPNWSWEGCQKFREEGMEQEFDVNWIEQFWNRLPMLSTQTGQRCSPSKDCTILSWLDGPFS